MALKEEQIRVIDHNEGNLLVSASAGSGKTFTMIERLKRLIIEKKASLSEILAVTFTEKAASEMKEKLLKSLIKEINSGKAELKSEIDELSTADICTFHSFCGRTLRSNFYYVGLSDDFEVIDELESDKIKEEVIEKIFEEEYANNSDGFKMLIERHSGKNRKDNDLRNMILKIYSFLFSEAEPVNLLESSVNIYTEEGFIKVIGDFENLLKDKLRAISKSFINLKISIDNVGLDKYSQHINEFLQDIEILLNYDIYRIKEYDVKKRLPLVKINGDDITSLELKKNLENLKKKYYGLFDILENITSYEEDKKDFLSVKGHTIAFIDLEKKFIEAYSLQKLDENKLDFNDLEHYMLKLLDNKEIKNEISNKYKYIFADEYQDTNGVQEVILSSISKNNIYMVGDIKQSIYAFRGCNPDIFTKKQVSMNDNEKAFLNYNFRSSDKVLEAVNNVFDNLMTVESAGLDYKKTSRLIGGGLYPEGEGRFNLCLYEKETDDEDKNEIPRIYDIYEEAKILKEKKSYPCGKIIAKTILSEIQQKYFDVETDSYKSVTYGDIAILLRSMTNADKIIEELYKWGIPVASESKNDILEYKEIKIFVELLKLIDNYSNEIPLVSTLKNIWGINDFELAEIKTYANEYDKKRLKEIKKEDFEATKFYDAVDLYILLDTELSKKLAEFKNYITEIRVMSGSMSASEILEKIIGDKNLDAKLLSHDLGKQKHKRLTRFLSESVVGGKKLSIREFLSRIESSNGAFTMAEVAGDDAVKVMTVHASKGLEFPVVIVPIDVLFNFSDTTDDIIKDRNFGVVFKCYNEEKRTVKDTILRSYVKQIMKQDEIKEEMRLFYVAMTRAKYSLYLVGKEKTIPQNLTPFDVMSANKFSDFLSGIPSEYYFGSEYSGKSEKNSTRNIIIGKPDEQAVNIIRKNLSFVYLDSEATTLPLKTSVTALLNSEKVNEEYRIPVISGETDAEKGTLVHKFLENYDFGSDFESETTRIFASSIFSEDEKKLINVNKLRNILSGELMKSLNQYRLYREQSFIINLPAYEVMDTTSKEDILVQGIIDLLAVKGDKALLIDYKYSSRSREALIQKYSKQLRIYREAVTKSLGLKVEKTYIISLINAEMIEID